MCSYHYYMAQTHFMFLLTPRLTYLTVGLDGTAEEDTIWWNFVGPVYSYL